MKTRELLQAEEAVSRGLAHWVSPYHKIVDEIMFVDAGSVAWTKAFRRHIEYVLEANNVRIEEPLHAEDEDGAEDPFELCQAYDKQQGQCPPVKCRTDCEFEKANHNDQLSL